jgi:hypothetical protein
MAGGARDPRLLHPAALGMPLPIEIRRREASRQPEDHRICPISCVARDAANAALSRRRTH